MILPQRWDTQWIWIGWKNVPPLWFCLRYAYGDNYSTGVCLVVWPVLAVSCLVLLKAGWLWTFTFFRPPAQALVYWVLSGEEEAAEEEEEDEEEDESSLPSSTCLDLNMTLIICSFIRQRISAKYFSRHGGETVQWIDPSYKGSCFVKYYLGNFLGKQGQENFLWWFHYRVTEFVSSIK